MHWWVLVDEHGGNCFHCGWLPLADAVWRARSVMAEWPAEVLDAVVAQPGPTPADLPPLFSDALVAPGAQHVSWHGRWFLQRWLPGADVQPERVQAFAVTATGEAVLVSSSIEGSDWGLPGGGIEPGEGALEALAREIAEEACARLIDADYLGSYEGVEPLGPGSTGPTYQAKYWARIELDAFVPRFEIRRRSLVPYRDAPARLTAWRQPAAAAFLAAGVAAEDRRRAAPSGRS
jgi:8-oxo-dGTP pyrophosphatase MutT (NUDIX family)